LAESFEKDVMWVEYKTEPVRDDASVRVVKHQFQTEETEIA
jgi:hypothetical protein